MFFVHLQVLLQNRNDSYHSSLYHNLFTVHLPKIINGEFWLTLLFQDCWVLNYGHQKCGFTLVSGVRGYRVLVDHQSGLFFFCCLKTINNNFYFQCWWSWQLCYVTWAGVKKGLEEDSTSDHCNAEAVALSGQLGAGHYVGVYDKHADSSYTWNFISTYIQLK